MLRTQAVGFWQGGRETERERERETERDRERETERERDRERETERETERERKCIIFINKTEQIFMFTMTRLHHYKRGQLLHHGQQQTNESENEIEAEIRNKNCKTMGLGEALPPAR